MPIRRGESWGDAVPVPTGLRMVHSDAEASEVIGVALASGTHMPDVALVAGDLARTMGGATTGRFTDGRDVVRAPVDLWRVETDTWSGWSLAHVVMRRGWWHGGLVLAMNAQFLGDYDVAPRSHPYDGRLDVIEVQAAMTLRARLQARRRARSGTHLPHPMLQTSQRTAWESTVRTPHAVWVDGVNRGRSRTLRVTMHPDPVVVHA